MATRPILMCLCVTTGRPIKIEIVVDEDEPKKSAPATTSSRPSSLLDRIAPAKPGQAVVPQLSVFCIPYKIANVLTLFILRNSRVGPPVKNAPAAKQQVAQAPVAPTKVKLRTKKGPRRLNKERNQQQLQGKTPRQKPQKKTLEQLDAEMDDYIAQGDVPRVKTSDSAAAI